MPTERRDSPPAGLLVVNKPRGMTSRRVVDIVQRLVRPAKAGHAGTLDPLAEGVVVVCVGTATRLIDYVQRLPKRYTGTFLLGRTSPTEDVEGEVTPLASATIPTAEALAAAARLFVGRIEQRPPAYSALKVGGRRAYDLARRGQAVELAPRPIDVHSLSIGRYEYPELVLEIECGRGTYVRSMGRDLARAVGTDAVMSALVRTAIGGFMLEGAVAPEQLSTGCLAERLLPPVAAVADLPAIRLSAEEARRLAHGLPIEGQGALAASELAAIDEGGRLVGILVPRDGVLRPSKTFFGGHGEGP
jgi:tRNA pseudouridine55 synthase